MPTVYSISYIHRRKSKIPQKCKAKGHLAKRLVSENGRSLSFFLSVSSIFEVASQWAKRRRVTQVSRIHHSDLAFSLCVSLFFRSTFDFRSLKIQQWWNPGTLDFLLGSPHHPRLSSPCLWCSPSSFSSFLLSGSSPFPVVPVVVIYLSPTILIPSFATLPIGICRSHSIQFSFCLFMNLDSYFLCNSMGLDFLFFLLTAKQKRRWRGTGRAVGWNCIMGA